ncbi:hypothetical protein FHS29_005405 [Saccharothrix tamanrassetensis]|uniref:Uncharacterized protein n=1 Tax=Saccharothrix tamanrassetensis TaxID=1051531 RepID=A0A841CTP2_9PSEU|nr:hypothetical protein [Saccharothrix tamanrassetensis]MBB5958796.1 hypothetical protein [Saccharothrix tamanrassetensis]
MTDTEEELRRLLARRADRVRSHLSGPAIRARAGARPRRGALRRYAPLASAAAVLAVVAVSLFLIPHGSPDRSDPARPPSSVTQTPRSAVTESPPPSVWSSTTKPESSATDPGSRTTDPGSRTTDPGSTSATTTTSRPVGTVGATTTFPAGDR